MVGRVGMASASLVVVGALGSCSGPGIAARLLWRGTRGVLAAGHGCPLSGPIWSESSATGGGFPRGMPLADLFRSHLWWNRSRRGRVRKGIVGFRSSGCQRGLCEGSGRGTYRSSGALWRGDSDRGRLPLHRAAGSQPRPAEGFVDVQSDARGIGGSSEYHCALESPSNGRGRVRGAGARCCDEMRVRAGHGRWRACRSHGEEDLLLRRVVSGQSAGAVGPGW